MEIDEYIQQKKAAEARKALDDAKRKLREEKDKLIETKRKTKLRERDDDVYIPPKEASGGIVIKPWMLWNLIILFIVIVLFGILFFTLREGKVKEADLQRMIDEAVEEETSVLEEKVTEKDDLIKSLQEKVQEIEEEEKVEEEKQLIEADLPPKFLLEVIDSNREDIGHKGEITIINGTESKYYVVLTNQERKIIYCDADRTVEGKTTEDYFQNLKLDVLEKEDIPQEVTGTGRIDLEYEVRCTFSDSDAEARQSIQFFYYFE